MSENQSTVKQVVELPLEQFESFVEGQRRILGALQEIKAIKPVEYYTAYEFMNEVKIRRWKFNQLRESGKLKVIQRGHKLYVPSGEVQRYFRGEME
ncbi:hypothetical protein [uncultured Imperialibacter sp.]|uniref:hypothetical protein n=1 Tax=uncultured Imperialibacter sp. TaxID=1672639 RepID=UPI0030DA5BC5|tara:strand:- start:188 stop:475 length:288 start_codon:yes stop_codon:yes gene_type:complete